MRRSCTLVLFNEDFQETHTTCGNIQFVHPVRISGVPLGSGGSQAGYVGWTFDIPSNTCADLPTASSYTEPFVFTLERFFVLFLFWCPGTRWVRSRVVPTKPSELMRTALYGFTRNISRTLQCIPHYWVILRSTIFITVYGLNDCLHSEISRIHALIFCSHQTAQRSAFLLVSLCR